MSDKTAIIELPEWMTVSQVAPGYCTVSFPKGENEKQTISFSVAELLEQSDFAVEHAIIMMAKAGHAGFMRTPQTMREVKANHNFNGTDAAENFIVVRKKLYDAPKLSVEITL